MENANTTTSCDHCSDPEAKSPAVRLVPVLKLPGHVLWGLRCERCRAVLESQWVPEPVDCLKR